MKNVLLLFISLPLLLFPQSPPISGVAVLFDNSGSMIQNFTKNELNEANELVKSLLTTGNYDNSKWNRTGTVPLTKLFNNGNLLYLHAFGNFVNNKPVANPEISYPSNLNELPGLIDNFYGMLKFTEQWTLLECARLFSWSFITDELNKKNKSGKNFYTKVIQVTDEVGEGASKCSELMLKWVESSGTVYSENIFELKSTLAKNNTLYCYIYTIGPHTFEKIESDCVPQINFSAPLNNQKYKDGVLTVPLRWDVKCDVSDIKLVIRAVSPSVQVHTTNVGNSRVYNLDLNKVKTILDDKKFNNPVKFRAIITGKIRDQFGKDSTISTSVNFAANIPADPFPIFGIVMFIVIIGAIFAGILFLPKLIDKIKNSEIFKKIKNSEN